jgi:hypothetical protein
MSGRGAVVNSEGEAGPCRPAPRMLVPRGILYPTGTNMQVAKTRCGKPSVRYVLNPICLRAFRRYPRKNLSPARIAGIARMDRILPKLSPVTVQKNFVQSVSTRTTSRCAIALGASHRDVRTIRARLKPCPMWRYMNRKSAAPASARPVPSAMRLNSTRQGSRV